MYFKSVCPQIYQELHYLKPHDKFYKDISIANGISSEAMFRFSDNIEVQEKHKSVTEKFIWDGKEMRENINDNERELFQL